MNRSVREELIDLANEWDRAMVGNDAESIGRSMADDWTIIGPDHIDVRVYGDTAVVTSRGVSGGKYQGQAFRDMELSSCVFVRQEGQWRCVLTHLSRILTDRG